MDERTIDHRFADAERFAARHSRSLFDTLVEADLIATPNHDRRVKVAVLAELWGVLHTMDASGLLQAKFQRSDGTPRDLMLALLEVLDRFGTEVQEGRR